MAQDLESRYLLTGGLEPEIVDGADPFVRLDSEGGEEIEIRSDSDTGTSNLFAFFNAADGGASPTVIDGTIKVDGTEIGGRFTFDEISASGGVSIVATDATVQFGDPVGIQISDADGVFVLLSTGIAGQLQAHDATDTDDIQVVGLPGLEFDSPFGLAWEVNTADGAVDVTVDSQSISFTEGNVEQIAGAGEFRVDGAIGPVVATEGVYTMTEAADGTLSVAAVDVGAELSVGDIRAVAMSSASAQFTLGIDADTSQPTFSLVPNSFVVSGFALLPTGTVTDLDADNDGGGQATLLKAQLGPLALSRVSMTFPTLELAGSDLTVGAGLSANVPGGEARLTFKNDDGGSSDSQPMTVVATKPSGEIQVRGTVNQSSGLIDTFGLPGKFTLNASKVELKVPDLLEASAVGATLSFDPTAGFDQELFSADVVTVNVTPLEATGQFIPTANSRALVVRGDGFQFGRGQVTLNNLDIQIGDNLNIKDPFVRLTDFAFSFDTGITLGEFAVGANRVRIAPPGDNPSWSILGESITAAVSFDDNFGVEDVKFTINTLTGTLGSHLTLSTTDTTFLPTASGDEEFLRIAGSVSAEVKAGAVTLDGSLSRFAIQADGDFVPLSNFGATFGIGLTRPADMLFPEYIPLQLEDVGIRWPDFQKDPANFQLIFPAA